MNTLINDDLYNQDRIKYFNNIVSFIIEMNGWDSLCEQSFTPSEIEGFLLDAEGGGFTIRHGDRLNDHECFIWLDYKNKIERNIAYQAIYKGQTVLEFPDHFVWFCPFDRTEILNECYSFLENLENEEENNFIMQQAA